MKTNYIKISVFLSLFFLSAFMLKAQPSTNNLTLWMDAGSGLTKDVNDYISSWNDQSANAYNLQQSNLDHMPMYIANAVNGHPAINFDGINDVLKGVVPVNGANELTFFLVSKCLMSGLNATARWNGGWNNVNSTVTWLETSWGGIHLNAFQEGFYPRFSTGVQFNPVSTPLSGFTYAQPITDFTLIKASFIRGQIKINLNGVDKFKGMNIIPGDSIANTTDSVFFGVGVPATSTYFPGQIAEFLVYKGSIDSISESKTEKYLLSKYGIINAIIDQEKQVDFTIFPNPTTDEITIKNNQFDIRSISITDIQGRLIYHDNENIKNVKTINLSNFQSGVYFIQLVNENTCITKKFVKQ